MAAVEVRLPQGRARGESGSTVERFLGLPYAQPPVGSRRFRPPVPAAVWEGVRNATAFGPIAPQLVDDLDALMGMSAQPQSEQECLTLNVWRPAGTTAGDALPVLVWIHGGALVGGASSSELYSGSSFARDGVVFVGLNYRLHALGFVAVGAATGEPGTTNLGLQDVTLALRWVHDSISALGGDPGNITVFGESAGGALTSALLAYRPARGLFGRAIMESGTAVVLHDEETATLIARNALVAWGVDRTDRAALEGLPVERVLETTDEVLMAGASGGGGFPWMLTRDPDGLDMNALEAVEAGRADGVELILGWTVDEYRLRWLTTEPDGPAVGIARLPADLERRALEMYRRALPEAGDDEVVEKVANDQHFLAPAVRIAEAHARRGGSSRLYEFRWRSPVQGGRIGACHALEIPFVFDQPVAPEFHGTAPLPAALVTAMHRAWIDFATSGSPRIAGEDWPTTSAERPTLAGFDAHTTIEEDFLPDVRSLWADAAPNTLGVA